MLSTVPLLLFLPFARVQASKLHDDIGGPDLLVVPQPTSYTTGQEVLCLSPDFTISFDHDIPGHSIPEDLKQAVTRTEKRIWETKHRYLSVERGADFFDLKKEGKHVEGKRQEGCRHTLHSLRIDIDTPGSKVESIMHSAVRPAEERPELEKYKLSIPLSDPAVIKASTALGAFRGLTSFENLFYYLPPSDRAHLKDGSFEIDPVFLRIADEGGQLPLRHEEGWTESKKRKMGRWYTPAAPYEIEDKPEFGWRAVMLDTSRNWFSKKSILKMLDTMAMVKLNVFHWHITDSDSWPLDLASHPELAGNGAYSSEEKYTEADIKEITRFAGERGIDVVLEIDTPGHTASIAPSHPDLVACFEREPWQTYSGQPPAGQLRFASGPAVEFTKSIFESTLDLVHGQYFGTGGDEVNEDCMLEDKETVAALKQHGWSLDDAVNDFTGKTHATILARGKTPVVWQEMLLNHGDLVNLSRDAIVDIWIDSSDARRVLDKGFRIIHASSDYFYLGHGMGDWVGRPTRKDDFNFGRPYKSWQRIYSFDPYDNVDESQRERVLGGQVSLWAEQADETNFESLLWPRAASLAEVFWTGPGKDGYPRSSIEAFPRMHDIRYRLVERGVNAPPLQPHWCALRPGVCVEDS